MSEGTTISFGGIVFEDVALAVSQFYPDPVANALPESASHGDDVVLPHDPSLTYKYLTALEHGGVNPQIDSVSLGNSLFQGLKFFAMGMKARKRASGSKGSGGPSGVGGPPASTPPAGNPPPPDEEQIVQMWMKELGISSNPRIKNLSSRERAELARIASRNRGYALGLVNNDALQVLHLTGVKGTDQLGLVLTILDRLEHAGVTNNGAYFSEEKLFSLNSYELAGIITEMAYLAVVADNAGVNGFRTTASQHTAVPWEVLPNGLFAKLTARLPKIDNGVLARIRERSEIDGYVIGDRIVEIKLRARGKIALSRQDSSNDQDYFRDQIQALKLMAIAKRDGLRGVEFALYADAVDEQWVKMVCEASRQIGVGAQISLFPAAGGSVEIFNNMPPMVRRGAAVAVSLPPVPPPPPKKRVTKKEQEWGVEPEAVDFMLGFIKGDAKVRSAAALSPRGFNKTIRPTHTRAIMDGYKNSIDEYFAARDESGVNEEVQESKKAWLDRWGTLNDLVGRQGVRLSTSTAIAMAKMGKDINALIQKHEDALTQINEARGRFLDAALPLVSNSAATLTYMVNTMDNADYTAAPTILWNLDRLREVRIKVELADILRNEGLDDLADLSLQELLEEIEKWKGQRRIAGEAYKLHQEVSNFIDLWRSMIDRTLPYTMDRWREELEIVKEIAPSTEPFPMETAREFLARFEEMSSTGAKKPAQKRPPADVVFGNWIAAVSLLGLDGQGLTPVLGAEVAATMALMPSDVELFPAEAERLRYAIDGIQLYHVLEKESGVYYYLPQMHTAAVRMIRAVLLTALLRHRAGTTLGFGRHLIFPWVMASGQRGQQPFWLEVNTGGNPSQLVLERIVVIDKSQLPPKAVQEFLSKGLNLSLPKEGIGSSTEHFDLIPPISGKVPVDTFTPPKDVDVDGIANELIQASFRDRHPEGRHIEGESRFQPVEPGYLTIPEIEQMRIQDAYLRRRDKVADVETSGEGEEAEKADSQRFFTKGRIRSWSDFVEQYLEVQRMKGKTDLKPTSYYFLRVRLSHRGATRVLLHLDRIRQDFGEHMRLKRIPGFALATEIAPRGAEEQVKMDAYGEKWTHGRLVDLFYDIETKVPEWERGRYIRRFRTIAGGSRFSSLVPGQVALNFEALRRSPWGVYFRVMRPAGFFRRQDLMKRGMSSRAVELITQFIQRHVPEAYQTKYFRRIRGYTGRNEVIYNLPGLAQAYTDRIPGDLLAEIKKFFPKALSFENWRTSLERTIADLGQRIGPLPDDIKADLLERWQKIRFEFIQSATSAHPNLTPNTRDIFKLEVDVINAERTAMARELGCSEGEAPEPDRGSGSGGAGGAPSTGGSPSPAGPPSGGQTSPPSAASAQDNSSDTQTAQAAQVPQVQQMGLQILQGAPPVPQMAPAAVPVMPMAMMPAIMPMPVSVMPVL